MKIKYILRFLLALPVVAVLAYAGFKGYLYYRVKQSMADLVAAAEPYAAITYGGIGSDILAGSLEVRDIEVTPRGMDLPIEISTVRVEGGEPRFLWELVQGLNPGRPPPQLTLRIKSASVPADAVQFSNWVPEVPNTARPQHSMDACGVSGLLHPLGGGLLGRQRLNVDTAMGYDSRHGESVVFFMEYRVRGVESLRSEFSAPGGFGPGQVAAGAFPSGGRFSMRYSVDPKFLDRALAACAKQRKQRKDDFIDDLLTRSDDYYLRTLGFVPGKGIREAMLRYFREPGEIHITASPSEFVTPASLGNYRPQDLVSLLDLVVRVNDEPLHDLSFTVPEGQGNIWSALGGPQDTASSAPQDGASGRAEQKPKEDRAKRRVGRYIETDISELESHVGRNVRLFTSDGSEATREGILVGLAGGDVTVEKRLPRGKMKMHIPVEKVTRAEVYRYVEQ